MRDYQPGPLPQPTHRGFQDPTERYTAAQMIAYARSEIARRDAEWAAEVERMQDVLIRLCGAVEDRLKPNWYGELDAVLKPLVASMKELDPEIAAVLNKNRRMLYAREYKPAKENTDA